MLLYLGTGAHGDHLTRFFGSRKGIYSSQWPFTGCYFKCWLCHIFFENGYQYKSFDAESSTNVPIKGTVDIILRQIYQGIILRPSNFNKFEKTDFEKTYLWHM